MYEYDCCQRKSLNWCDTKDGTFLTGSAAEGAFICRNLWENKPNIEIDVMKCLGKIFHEKSKDILVPAKDFIGYYHLEWNEHLLSCLDQNISEALEKVGNKTGFLNSQILEVCREMQGYGDYKEGHPNIHNIAIDSGMRLEVDIFKYMTFGNFKQSNTLRFKRWSNGLRSMAIIRADFPSGYSVLDHGPSWSINIFDDGMFCKHPKCPDGTEMYFGKTTIQYETEVARYGYGCRKCPENFFKSQSMASNSTCRKCPEMTISSEDRASCYNSYRLDYFKFTDKISMLVISVSGIGLAFSVFTMVLLWINRKTPFAKATNVYYSTVYLVLVMLQFSSLPLIFVGKPFLEKCYLRPTVVLILATTPAIIISIKSQNILAAFHTKTIVSNKQRNKNIAIQYSVAALIFLVDASVLLWTMIVHPPAILTHINHSNFIITLDCNTGVHINTQISLLIIQNLFVC